MANNINKEERQKLQWGSKPLEFICDVFPGDTITLKFNRHGKLYIKPMEVICEHSEIT